MTQPSTNSRSTRVSQIIKAPREAVYRAIIEPDAVAAWLSPDKMSAHVEIFEPRKGGKFRMSLTYLDQKDRPRGKTSDDTDTSEGTFAELIPNQKIVWLTKFESDLPEMTGEMKITWSLTDVAQGTEVGVLFEDIPQGISLEDNELGSRQSLRKLAAFVENAANNPSSA